MFMYTMHAAWLYVVSVDSIKSYHSAVRNVVHFLALMDFGTLNQKSKSGLTVWFGLNEMPLKI